MKLFIVTPARSAEQRSGEIDKIAVWKRLFQKVNRTQASRLLALRGQMDGGENDGARIGMTCSQVVKKLLAEIVGRIDIENEEIGFGPEDVTLRLFQAGDDVHLRAGRGFLQRLGNRGGQLLVRFKHQHLARVVR